MHRGAISQWITASGLAALCSMLCGQASARLVPKDEPGQPPSSGSAGGASAPDPDACSNDDILDCADLGGFVEQRPQGCWCEIYEWVPRRVINAGDGDVGIVPIDGRGSEFVTALTESIGQLHRHAVMFYADGRYARHDTMYVADAEDGSSSDAAGDYVPVLTPLIGSVRFDGDALANGLPGAISQTIDDTYARGRLGSRGLILKPALQINWTSGGFSEPDRPLFAAAVTEARATAAYYKLSDYTDLDSMQRPWRANRQGDLRGSHCSGYVAFFYREQGLSLSNVTYPRALRERAGELLFDKVLEQCRDETGFWSDVTAAITGHWSVCTNLANQVTNCFADQGCHNLTDDWRDVGSGSTLSPDNLLPDSFKYNGTKTYDWDGTLLSSSSGSGAIPVGGKPLSHPGLAGSEPATSATRSSPFERVEALVYSGGYSVVVESVRM